MGIRARCIAVCKADQHSSADPDLGDDVTRPIGLIIPTQQEIKEKVLNGTAVIKTRVKSITLTHVRHAALVLQRPRILTTKVCAGSKASTSLICT